MHVTTLRNRFPLGAAHGLRPVLVSLACLFLASACADAPASPQRSGAVDPDSGLPCPAPQLETGLTGVATSDATSGDHPLFRRISVPGVTDAVAERNGGLPALVDLDRDGRTDIVMSRTTSLAYFHNAGCFRFERQPLTIVGSGFTADSMPWANQGIVFADLNEDGFLDGLVTGPSAGNELLLSQGSHDTFRDVAGDVGIQNRGAYNRQVQFGDVNGDGQLDIAIGADQIGGPQVGIPWQRLFVADPSGGTYRDAGGTDTVPGFGGEPNCDPDHDRDSPGILLRDLAGEGRLDLVQGYHDDMSFVQNSDPCVTGERTFGIFAWRNTAPGDGTVRFEDVPPGSNGLTDRGKLRYDADSGDYDVVSHGVGLPYIVAFDAFNSGRLDVLAVGPTDPSWHVQSDRIAGRFYQNLGGFRFADSTEQVGLDALDWTYGRWTDFWQAPSIVPDPLSGIGCAPGGGKMKSMCMALTASDTQMYSSSVVWGDFDNDGFVDFILCDRREDRLNAGTWRNVLFRNDGEHFTPVTSEESGLDTNTESIEAADLNGDGLLDLVGGTQPLNSYFFASTPGLELAPERSLIPVYVNTGAFGGATNHWVEIKLAGLPDRMLIGAEMTLSASGGGGATTFLGRRDYFPNDAYKASHELLAHWGLGGRTRALVSVALPSGERISDLELPCVDARVTLDVATRAVAGCPSPR